MSKSANTKGVLCAEISAKGVDDQGRFNALASARTLDRDGEVIEPLGAELGAYRRNPVLLALHKTCFESGSSPVVGKVLSITPTEDALPFVAQFAPVGLGPEYRELYAGGYMSAFSIGFLPLERRPDTRTVGTQKTRIVRIVRFELLEVSCVAVPSNREALIRAMAKDVAGRTAYDAYCQAALVAELKRHDRLDGANQIGDLVSLARRLSHQVTREVSTAARKDVIDRGVDAIVAAVADGLDRTGQAVADLEASLLLTELADAESLSTGDLAGPLSRLRRDDLSPEEIREVIRQGFEALVSRLQGADAAVYGGTDGEFAKAILYGLGGDEASQAGGVGGEELGGEEEAASEEAEALRAEAAKLLETVLGTGGNAA